MKNINIKEMHTGQLIQQKMKEEGRRADWLARKIHCHKNHIYRMYQQEHIHPALITQISIVLKHNFFTHYFDHVNEQITV